MNLKDLHRPLYERARVKSFLSFFLGLSVIYGQHAPHVFNSQLRESTQLNNFLPYDVWGLIWVILGVLIYIGLYSPKNIFRLARWSIFTALIYNLFWMYALIYATIYQSPQSAGVLIVWAYMVYNHWLVFKDPGWEATQIVKKAEPPMNGNGNGR